MATRGSPLIHARIDRVTARRLRAYAEASGRSITELLRAAIALYLEHEHGPHYPDQGPDGQMSLEDMPPE